jgi:elongation factor Ts
MIAISAKMVKELRERTGLGLMDCKKALASANGDIELAIEELRKSGQAKAAKKASRTAAEGLVVTKISPDNSFGVILEINSETDFVSRDDNFIAYAHKVLQRAYEQRSNDVAQIMAGELETARLALIQKVGENITVRRIHCIEGRTIGSYVHGNNRIAVLVQLDGGNLEVAKDVAMHVAAINPTVVNKDDMPETLVQKEKEIFVAQAQQSGKPDAIIEKIVSGRVQKFLSENSLSEQPFVKNPDIKISELVKTANGTVLSFIRFEVGEGIEKAEVDFVAEVKAQAGL